MMYLDAGKSSFLDVVEKYVKEKGSSPPGNAETSGSNYKYDEHLTATMKTITIPKINQNVYEDITGNNSNTNKNQPDADFTTKQPFQNENNKIRIKEYINISETSSSSFANGDKGNVAENDDIHNDEHLPTESLFKDTRDSSTHHYHTTENMTYWNSTSLNDLDKFVSSFPTKDNMTNLVNDFYLNTAKDNNTIDTNIDVTSHLQTTRNISIGEGDHMPFKTEPVKKRKTSKIDKKVSFSPRPSPLVSNFTASSNFEYTPLIKTASSTSDNVTPYLGLQNGHSSEPQVNGLSSSSTHNIYDESPATVDFEYLGSELQNKLFKDLFSVEELNIDLPSPANLNTTTANNTRYNTRSNDGNDGVSNDNKNNNNNNDTYNGKVRKATTMRPPSKSHVTRTNKRHSTGEPINFILPSTSTTPKMTNVMKKGSASALSSPVITYTKVPAEEGSDTRKSNSKSNYVVASKSPVIKPLKPKNRSSSSNLDSTTPKMMLLPTSAIQPTTTTTDAPLNLGVPAISTVSKKSKTTPADISTKSSSPSLTPNGKKVEKKTTHREAEAERRNRLNNALTDLNSLLPEGLKKSVSIQSKAVIVELASKYIRQLLQELERK
ncbi:phosphate-sensing transcription factor PHO4 NDAI_0G02020 [Naumovozyma dairenensis CBS 421]|uniref:BHLH domain-containing protein n=1 Tax=Naumovozyma dairenensis (strain ATCC 10597 / BCRC 20456 / CBS 421 / NBRC 0211 / NRRL Y-12639) TaxID=1071378 RepID=G0WDW6_NAUDC|nr:hypothetical protein NDAI_0G02020 [Naumovozyma dairenensis CBS 421]CCD25977.2 hypothetical protein NDAI_0G02020 [Naumovozyma dairenensis CBS 421]